MKAVWISVARAWWLTMLVAVFQSAAWGQKLLTAMGNRVGDGLLGLIFPDSDAEWFVAMRFMMGRKKEAGGSPPQA